MEQRHVLFNTTAEPPPSCLGPVRSERPPLVHHHRHPPPPPAAAESPVLRYQHACRALRTAEMPRLVAALNAAVASEHPTPDGDDPFSPLRSRSGSSHSAWADLPRPVAFALSHTPLLGAAGAALAQGLAALPRPRRIALEHCCLDDAGIESVCRALRPHVALEALSLAGNPSTTFRAVAELLPFAPHLRSLDLSFVLAGADVVGVARLCRALAALCPLLEELRLRRCGLGAPASTALPQGGHLQDEADVEAGVVSAASAVADVVRGCKRLRTLDVAWNEWRLRPLRAGSCWVDPPEAVALRDAVMCTSALTECALDGHAASRALLAVVRSRLQANAAASAAPPYPRGVVPEALRSTATLADSLRAFSRSGDPAAALDLPAAPPPAADTRDHDVARLQQELAQLRMVDDARGRMLLALHDENAMLWGKCRTVTTQLAAATAMHPLAGPHL